MMNFERNGKAKESMGIGLTGEALEISSVQGDLSLMWEDKEGRRKHRGYKLKKRWYVPIPRVISLMNMEKVPMWKLRLAFKAHSLEPDFLETFWEFVTPWICIRNRNRKIRRCKKYAEVDLNDMNIKKYNEYDTNRSYLSFIVISEELEKIQKIKDSEKPLYKVIYKEKIYDIKPNSKTLR